MYEDDIFRTNCAVCLRPAELMCSRCNEQYCTINCQIFDWVKHKKYCSQMPNLISNTGYNELVRTASPQTVLFRPNVTSTTQNAHKFGNFQHSRALKPLRKPNVSGNAANNEVENIVPVSPQRLINEPGSPLAAQLIITATPENRKSQFKGEIAISHHSTTDSRSPPTTVKARLSLESLLKQESQPKTIDDDVTVRNELTMRPEEAIPEIVPQDLLNTPGKLTVSSVSGRSSPALSQGKPWLSHFPLEKKSDKPFEVVIQYIDHATPNRLWVTLVENEAECEKLLREINEPKNCVRNNIVTEDDIKVNEIFAAPYEGALYRVIVIDEFNKNFVKVRLIDYGNEITVRLSELYQAIPIMRNLRAFSFRVMVKNFKERLNLEQRIWIRVILPGPDFKVVEICESPMFELGQAGGVVSITGNGRDNKGKFYIYTHLNEKMSIVASQNTNIKPIIKALECDLADLKNLAPVKNADVGQIVIVSVDDIGWCRAKVMGAYDQCYVLFIMDLGSFDVYEEKALKACPEEFANLPKLSLLMNVRSVPIDPHEFRKVYYQDNNTFDYEVLDYDNKKNELRCGIKIEGNLFAETLVQELEVDFEKLNIPYWPMSPRINELVYVTMVLSFNVLFVCPVEKINVYTDLIFEMSKTLERLNRTPKIDEIVVGSCDMGSPFRGQVLALSKDAKEVELLDLDKGDIKLNSVVKLLKPTEFIRFLPVHVQQVEIKDLNKVKIKDESFVIQFWTEIQAKKRELKIIYDGPLILGVKLTDVTSNRTIVAELYDYHDRQLASIESEANKKLVEEEARKAKLTEEEVRKAKLVEEEARKAKLAEEEARKAEEEALKAKLVEEEALKAKLAEEERLKKKLQEEEQLRKKQLEEDRKAKEAEEERVILKEKERLRILKEEEERKLKEEKVKLEKMREDELKLEDTNKTLMNNRRPSIDISSEADKVLLSPRRLIADNPFKKVIKPYVKVYNTDLVQIQMKIGENITLKCLDTSLIASKAVVCVCDPTEDCEAFYMTIESLVNAEAKKMPHMDSYKPDIEEVCLAIFKEDNLWYRATCVSQEDADENFTVVFTDYGNMDNINKTNIRQLPDALKLSIYHNIAKIENIAHAKGIIRDQLLQEPGNIIKPKNVTFDGEIYTLTF